MKDWAKNIPEQGVLCWASDNVQPVAEEKHSFILARIDRLFDDNFMDSEGYVWKYATPISRKEWLDLEPII